MIKSINVCKIPKGIDPKYWIQNFISRFCEIYELNELEKSVLVESLNKLYEEAGVFVPDWREVATERSATISMTKLYKKILQSKLDLDDPVKSGKGRIVSGKLRDSYFVVLSYLYMFQYPYYLETLHFGNDTENDLTHLFDDNSELAPLIVKNIYDAKFQKFVLFLYGDVQLLVWKTKMDELLQKEFNEQDIKEREKKVLELEEKDKLIEDLKAQISIYEIEKTKEPTSLVLPPLPKPMIEEDEMDVEVMPNPFIPTINEDLDSYSFSSIPSFEDTNLKNLLTNERIKEIKEKIKRDDKKRMNMIDINPLILSVRINETWMEIFRLIGEQGMSQVPQIKECLEKTMINTCSNSSINMQINNMIRNKILIRENINTGYRRFIVVDFTPIGVRVFEKIFGKSPIETERQRLERENYSVEHGYLIQDTMDILRKEFGYTMLTIDRQQNTIKLENEKNYTPSIVATIDGKTWDYIEVERGTCTQKDFNDKLNKMIMVTRTFYFVSQNQDMLNNTIGKIEKWVEEIGFENLKGLTINFSTLSHLAKRNWSKTIKF